MLTSEKTYRNCTKQNFFMSIRKVKNNLNMRYLQKSENCHAFPSINIYLNNKIFSHMLNLGFQLQKVYRQLYSTHF